jgi:hypothetical protein
MFSLFGLTGVGTLNRGVYVVSVTLVIAIAAVWLGFSALADARRGATYRPRGAIVGTTLGGLGLVFSALALIALAIFWKELTAYSNCMSGANTVAAQDTCQSQFGHSVNNKIHIIRSGR